MRRGAHHRGGHHGIADRVVWVLAHVLALPLLYVYPLRMRSRGAEHLPATGPILIVCNHVSVADPIILMAAARRRRTSMVAKRELFQKHAVFGWLLRALRAIPLDRSKPADFTAVRRAVALLEEGDAVVVFPEGHVSRGGTMRRGAPGAGFLGTRPGVTVIPAVVWNTQLFRGPARILFGPPVDLADIVAGAASRHERNRLATDRVMTVLSRMLPEVGGPVQEPPVGPQRPIDRTRGIWFPPPETPEPEPQPVA